jgi:hypothetical protein
MEEAGDEHDVDSEEEESDPTIVPKITYGKKSYQCMNCLTDESTIWRRSPSDFDRKRKVFYKVLCNDCGIYWLKYAQSKYISSEKKSTNSNSSSPLIVQNQNLTTITDEDKKRKRSTDGMRTMVKRVKENPVVSLNFKPSSCKICLHSGPPERLFTCYACGISVHDGKKKYIYL